MAIKKRITLHPLLNDGTPDENVNLYPKTLIDGIVDREGEQVEVPTKEELNSGLETKQDKLNAGENIVIEDNTISASVDLSDYYTKATINGLLAEKQKRIDENNTISADFVDDTHSNNKFVTNSEINVWNNKQDKLVSSVNIKTVNGNSLLGGGNILISAVASWGEIRGNMSAQQDLTTALNSKQGKLTAGTGIAITDNNVISATIEGIRYDVVQELPATGESGVIYLISNSGTTPNVYDEYIWVNNTFEKIGSTEIDLSNYYTKTEADNKFQVELVSGTNIKTINHQSVLGSGNLNVDPAGGANLTPLEVPEDYMDLMDFINNAETPETYTISNDNEVTIEILKQDTTETISISKGSIISVYPQYSATILSADGQYTYFIDGEYLSGGVSINYEEVEAIVDSKLGSDVVMANTDQTISGQKKFTSTNGTIFENGGGTWFRYLYSSPAFKIIPDNNGYIDFYYSDTQLGRLYAGNTVLYSNVRPNLNESVDLGSSRYNWNNVYVKSLVSGQVTKNVSKLVTNDSNLIPESNNLYSLGNSGFQWSSLYLYNTLRFNPQSETKIENLKNLTVTTINLGGQIGGSTSWDSAKFLQYDTTSVKYKGKLYAGLDVNNQPIRNIPDTPDEGTSPINKNYADTNLQGKLTFDNAPTQNSTNPVTSGGIWSALDTVKKDSYIPVDITTYPTLADFLASSGEEGYMYLYPIDTSDLTKGYYRYIWESNAWLNLGTTAIDLSNYVDLTSAQEISGAKTFLTVVLMKNNVGIKYGNSYSNGYTICNDGSGGLLFKNNYNVAKYHFNDSNFYPDVSGAGNLGSSTKAWGDLYLTGAINKNASTFGLTLPDTTNLTANDELVDSASTQTISGEKTISNAVSLKFAGTYTGQIVNQENQLRFKYGGSDKLKISTTNITFSAHLIPNSGNNFDLGTATYKLRNVYVGGKLSDGNNANYGLVLPNTTGWTANKTIATTDQITKQWFGTQAEYDALGTYDNDTIYNILES